MADPIIKIKVDDSEVKKTIKKVKRLRKLLKETNKLTYELYHKPVKVSIDAREVSKELTKQFKHDATIGAVK